MPGIGPAPKAVRSRARDTNRRESEMTEVEDEGEVYGPDLPEGVLPKDEPWHPQTVALWEELRRYPLMKDESGLSWAYLIDTMALHSGAWSRNNWERFAEVRIRLNEFGVTPAGRMRLRVKVKPQTEAAPSQAGGNSVADISSRRARLTS
jgi:hypothetical protein